MPGRQPVITGTGVVCAVGRGTSRVGEALRSLRSGLGPLTLFHSPRFALHAVGQVRESLDLPTIPFRGSRSDQLAWVAAQEALVQARLPLAAPLPQPDRVAITVGATVGGMTSTEQFLELLLKQHLHRFGRLRHHECGRTAALLAQHLGAQGAVLTFSTACSAGAMAIAAAATLIESGEADIVLTGGTDALCRLTLNGFGSLLLLDPAGCRPFDARRAGISLGEGAGFLVLESAESAAQREVRPLAILAGWGASCDAHHPTAPHPEGRGAALAIRRALERADWTPASIDFLSAHGTGTPDNDAMEAKAIQSVFGDRPPPVSSTIRFFGHTLAASGAIKAVVCVQALHSQEIPPNIGLESPDPALGFVPVREPTPCPLRRILSNSFGFGGNNVVLAIAAPEPPHSPTGSPSIVRRTATAPRRLAILGAAIVSPAGHSFHALAATLRHGGPTPTPVALPPPLGPAQVPALVCPEFNDDNLIDPPRRRRLSRLQQMVLTAARRSLPVGFDALPRDRIGVAIGTGLGSLSDTAAFVENLILRDERSPRPMHFTNSVHNALASQVALDLHATGLNTSPTQREVSFEAAVWQASHEFAKGGTDLFLAGAADELHPYLLATGRRWRWWSDTKCGAADPRFERLNGESAQGPGVSTTTFPGEGASVFAFAPGHTTVAPSLGYLTLLRIGQAPACAHRSAQASAEWILTALEQTGETLEGVDLLLVNRPLDDAGEASFERDLTRHLATAGRHATLVGHYHHACGVHASASAFGASLALALVGGALRRSDLLPAATADSTWDRPCRGVLLYTRSTMGSRALILVQPAVAG